MNEICLFLKVRTVDGKRDTVRKLWEKHLKQRATENENQIVYYYCFDNQDTNVIHMFEHYSNPEELQKNAQADWFQNYMNEVKPFLHEEPEVSVTTPVWSKLKKV